MNRDVLCQSRALSAFSCAKSLQPAHDERKEGRRSPQGDAQRPADGRTPTATSGDSSETEDGSGQRSPHRRRQPDEWPAAPEPPLLLLSNSLPHTPLTNNNNNNNGQQRRGARAKVIGKKPARRTAGAKNSQNRKVTDFYPIRRSSRKSKTELKCEQKKLLDDLITSGNEEGMEVQEIEGKGRAVFATRCFQKGEYVVEYHGDLLQITDARKREAEYAQDPATGCYMYYFQYLCKTYCVDATRESGRKGRLINHSKSGNCQTKLHDINGVPHLILVASRDIDKGEELLYDYGDRSKASIAAHPWLKY